MWLWNPTDLNFLLALATSKLCDLEQVASPLWDSIFSSVKWEHDNTKFFKGLLWGTNDIVHKTYLAQSLACGIKVFSVMRANEIGVRIDAGHTVNAQLVVAAAGIAVITVHFHGTE